MENQHSKESAQETMRSTQGMDIVDAILKDHKPLKRWIEVMKNSEASLPERIAAFEDFAPALIAHAKPEEEVLYTFMKQDEELREEAMEGEVEHGLADQLLEECKRTTDDHLLGARIKVLAELVEHHIEEEEAELLPDFKSSTNPIERKMLGDKFLQLKVSYLAAGDDNIIPDPKLDVNDETKEDLKH